MVEPKPKPITNEKDLVESANNIPEQIDEPLVKLMTSEVAQNVPTEWDHSLVNLDSVNLDR